MSDRANVSTDGKELRIAAGTVALDGSNPTPIATGLGTVVAAAFQHVTASGTGTDPTWFTYTASAGTISLYAWKPTNSSTTTLTASGSTGTVAWIAFGYGDS